MAQSLCKIYLHIIFHTKTTSPDVLTEHLPRLHQYVAQLVKTAGAHIISVGGTQYIQGQEEHHKTQTFREEYLQFLQLYKIEYDERYVLSD